MSATVGSMPEDRLPISQAEARRRLRAAMGFSGKTFEDLDRAPGYRESTWRTLGAGRDFKPRHALVAAGVCEVPYEWFTVADLAATVNQAVRAAAAEEAVRAAEDAAARRGAKRS